MLERAAVEEHRDRQQGHEQHLHAPGHGGGDDERVPVHEDAQHDRQHGLSQQRADEHLHPAQGDDPPAAGMDSDQQEDRPQDEQEQEAHLQHQQRHRHQEDEQARHQGGDERADGHAEPVGPVAAGEGGVAGVVPELVAERRVLRLAGSHVGSRLPGHRLRHRLHLQHLATPVAHDRLLRVGGAEQADQPRLADQRGPQRVGVLVDPGGAGLRVAARLHLRAGAAAGRRQAGRAARARQAGEGGVDHFAGLVGDDLAQAGEVSRPAEEPHRHRDRQHHPDHALGGRGGPLADQPVPGQPDGAEDDDRLEEVPVDGVGQPRDDVVDHVLDRLERSFRGRRLVRGDRQPVDGLGRGEDAVGPHVAEHGHVVGAGQLVGVPELPAHPELGVVGGRRGRAGRRGGWLDQPVGAAAHHLGRKRS